MTYTKDVWRPDEQAWFEYHCFESDHSQDADLWHRSHERVTVLRHGDHDPCVRDEAPTLEQRGSEYALPCLYSVRFDDGHEADAFEDELLTDRAGFFRPDPPVLPSRLY